MKERNINDHDRAGETCQTQSLLVTSVCRKIVPKALFSFMYEPGRLILVKVILEVELSVQKREL